MRNGWAVAAVASLVIGVPQLAAAAPANQTPPGVTVQKTAEGQVLASQGKTLYRIDLDRLAKRRKSASAMVEARWAEFAADLWTPVAPPKDFKPGGDWSVTPRKSGPQLTYKGDPLYTFAGKSLEEAAKIPVAPQYFNSYAGKTTVIADGVPVATLYYHPALFEPPAPKVAAPSGVTARWSKVAFVFADGDNHDLYTKSGKACAEGCDGLKPFAAPLAALPVGDWKPVEEKDGERYWAYRGRMVYQQASADADAPGAAWSRLEVH
jgi:predicted lipoprotein with Yx(FWY)xxD motif